MCAIAFPVSLSEHREAVEVSRLECVAFLREEDLMRAYVITTGIVFALLVVAHILRAIEEGLQLMKQPPYILTTLAAAALFVWAMSLLRRSPRP